MNTKTVSKEENKMEIVTEVETIFGVKTKTHNKFFMVGIYGIWAKDKEEAKNVVLQKVNNPKWFKKLRGKND